MEIAEHNIGGAEVRRAFTHKGASLKRGHHLSRDEVLALPAANRRALSEAGYMDIFSRGVASGETHVVHIGRGQYDVIVGTKLNDAPLSKDEADALAAGQ